MKLTDPEWELMSALWKRYPATARDVIDHLPHENHWAYTTVKTMLTRLVQKGAIVEKKRGAISIYEPLVSQETARKHALRNLFEKVLDGAVEPVMHYLIEEKKLSAKERRHLIQMLEQMDQQQEDKTSGMD
jgi:BlaI family transcriptional regulator, penicillinase repressor